MHYSSAHTSCNEPRLNLPAQNRSSILMKLHITEPASLTVAPVYLLVRWSAQPTRWMRKFIFYLNLILPHDFITPRKIIHTTRISHINVYIVDEYSGTNTIGHNFSNPHIVFLQNLYLSIFLIRVFLK